MPKENEIPVETLRRVIAYDAETGALTWLHRPRDFFGAHKPYATWNGRYAGTQAFTCTDAHGYKIGRFLKRGMKAHRVAFALHYGRWPEGDIDHIDGDRSNNRASNLREVSRADNLRNRGLAKNNTSGVMGVHKHTQCDAWVARIHVDGKERHLGMFKTIAEATAVRRAAEIEHGFHAGHGARDGWARTTQ